MNWPKLSYLLILASVGAVILAATPAGAQSWISYAAKFVCNAENVGDDVVVQGKYKTMVNIHNPHYLESAELPVPLIFFKKVVLAKPQGEPILPPTCHQQELLDADEALGVDCDNIKTLLGISGLPTTGDLEGFVVLQVPPLQGQVVDAPLMDVQVVYTARPRRGIDPDVRKYDIRTLDVEQVLPTEVIGDPEIFPCD